MRSACVLAVVILAGCSPSEDGNYQASIVEQNTTEAVAKPEAPLAQEVKAAPAEVNEGRCGMEECSYSQELRRQVIGGGANGRLIKLSLRGGTSSREGSKITWEKVPHDVYVYCSMTLPAVMLETDGSWQVDILDFINGVPGVLESSQSLYASTCHKGDSQFPNNAEALGYQQIPEDKQDVTVSKPEDIFSLSAN